jgi:hypothetical protein
MPFRPHHATTLLSLVRRLTLVPILLFIVGASSLVPIVAFGDEEHNSPSSSRSISPLITLAAATYRAWLPLISSYNTGMIPSKPTRVVIGAQATKISQLVGDYDRERETQTTNLTQTRYQLISTDLGVPFYHKGRIYLLFGDSFGGNGGDAIAHTTDFNPENGLYLDFIQNASGIYQPVIVPGISQNAFEVPMEGVSVNGRMYIYHTTDSTSGPAGDTMGRSVVAVSDNDGYSFAYQYDLSRQYFINVSIVQTEAAQWPGLPQTSGLGLVMFGSGAYRQSDVYLAFQPEAQIDTQASIRYFAGLDSGVKPTWSTSEASAKALFNQPCVGELSVSYNTFIRKWIMLYNCALSQTRGINMRWADKPWGPWSDPQIIFRPWEDNGYCHFIHTSWTFQKCDNVQDPGHENEWGGEYGPYQFETLATGNDTSTTIYFTMSTWNPYTVVLMKATLQAGTD